MAAPRTSVSVMIVIAVMTVTTVGEVIAADYAAGRITKVPASTSCMAKASFAAFLVPTQLPLLHRTPLVPQSLWRCATDFRGSCLADRS